MPMQLFTKLGLLCSEILPASGRQWGVSRRFRNCSPVQTIEDRKTVRQCIIHKIRFAMFRDPSDEPQDD